MVAGAVEVRQDWKNRNADVVEAQTTEEECCLRYDLTLHVPAEEWSPSTFVRRIQWKNTSSSFTVAPIRFSVEYCAGINLNGPCSSFQGEITIDGVIQEVGGSNGGAGSWPLPYCGNSQSALCQPLIGSGLPHLCRLVELFQPSTANSITHPVCEYAVDPQSAEPCENDYDHHLTIAEKIFQGQTKRFKRIWIIQNPDADPTTGSPPRLIQRNDPASVDPETGAVHWDCGPNVDQFVMIVQPWLVIAESQFAPPHPQDPVYQPAAVACRLIADACFPYRFYQLH